MIRSDAAGYDESAAAAVAAAAAASSPHNSPNTLRTRR